MKERFAGVFDRSASTYDTVIPFFARFANHLVGVAALRPGERVLDLACGSGAVLTAAAAAVAPGGHVVGVDVSTAMVERASLASAPDDVTIEARVGDAEALADADASFDAVLCGFGVFFFPDPATALREAKRVLAPGGRFVASTFTERTGTYPWLEEVAAAIRPPDPTARPTTTATLAASDAVRGALDEAGFVDATTTTVTERFTFRDVDDLLAWMWSHGGRMLLESLADDELVRYRSLAAERLEAHRCDDGFEFVKPVDITVATVPRVR